MYSICLVLYCILIFMTKIHLIIYSTMYSLFKVMYCILILITIYFTSKICESLDYNTLLCKKNLIYTTFLLFIRLFFINYEIFLNNSISINLMVYSTVYSICLVLYCISIIITNSFTIKLQYI